MQPGRSPSIGLRVSGSAGGSAASRFHYSASPPKPAARPSEHSEFNHMSSHISDLISATATLLLKLLFTDHRSRSPPTASADTHTRHPRRASRVRNTKKHENLERRSDDDEVTHSQSKSHTVTHTKAGCTRPHAGALKRLPPACSSCGVLALPPHLVLRDAALHDALRDDLLGLVDVLAGGLVERRLRRALLLACALSRQRLRRGSSLL
jgi:hypothetical protein